jgi:hypothetical protein
MMGTSVPSVRSKKSLSIGPEESGYEESIGNGEDVSGSEEMGNRQAVLMALEKMSLALKNSAEKSGP